MRRGNSCQRSRYRGIALTEVIAQMRSHRDAISRQPWGLEVSERSEPSSSSTHRLDHSENLAGDTKFTIS